VYQEIHILHEKNQARKKQKEWRNIENIFDALVKKYKMANMPKYHQIFANMFEYFTLCYSLELEEQPFYEELCQVLQQNL
jgi:hypothetical protein